MPCYAETRRKGKGKEKEETRNLFFCYLDPKIIRIIRLIAIFYTDCYSSVCVGVWVLLFFFRFLKASLYNNDMS